MSAATAVYAYPQRAPGARSAADRVSGTIAAALKGNPAAEIISLASRCHWMREDGASRVLNSRARGRSLSDDAYRQIRRKVRDHRTSFRIEQVWLWSSMNPVPTEINAGWRRSIRLMPWGI
jgi:hypothetical protein